jgi:hypothetical protein
MTTAIAQPEPLAEARDSQTGETKGYSVQRFVSARPRNEIIRVNNHAEIAVGNKWALVDLEDLPKVAEIKWSKHPRGPINEVVISKVPRRKKYKLMAMVIYGKAVSFVDGNKYDLRRPNVTNKRLRLGDGIRTGRKVRGIYYKCGHWTTQMRACGQIARRSFSVKKYGEAEARRLAKEARQMLVDLGIEKCKQRWKEFSKLPKLRKENEVQSAPLGVDEAMLKLATLYAQREHLNADMIPHLHRMLKIGGGRFPDLGPVNHKNLAPVNIYEGNQEYEDSVVDVPYDENGKWDGYHMER